MAASDSPTVGLAHPTADPNPTAAPTDGRAEFCECNSCDYAVEIGDDLPPKCPDCGGALTRVES